MACASKYSDAALSSMETMTEAIVVFVDLCNAVLSLENRARIELSFLISPPIRGSLESLWMRFER